MTDSLKHPAPLLHIRCSTDQGPCTTGRLSTAEYPSGKVHNTSKVCACMWLRLVPASWYWCKHRSAGKREQCALLRKIYDTHHLSALCNISKFMEPLELAVQLGLESRAASRQLRLVLGHSLNAHVNTENIAAELGGIGILLWLRLLRAGDIDLSSSKCHTGNTPGG